VLQFQAVEFVCGETNSVDHAGYTGAKNASSAEGASSMQEGCACYSGSSSVRSGARRGGGI